MAFTIYTTIEERVSVEYFRFEKDFVENGIRCIPMIVRYKLDMSGIKLKLKEWSQFSEQQREMLANMQCTTSSAIQAYRNLVITLIRERCETEPQFIEIEKYPRWMNTDDIDLNLNAQAQLYNRRISITQWAALSTLQRFALLKLCRPGHENRNFPLALKEFGLV